MRLLFGVLLLLLCLSPICGSVSHSEPAQIPMTDAGNAKDQIVIQPGPSDGKDTTIYCPATGYQYCNDGTRYDIQTNQPLYPNKILIQFPLDPIYSLPSNVVVTSALLQLYMETYYDSNGLTIGAYRIMVPWLEGTGNWTVTNDGANWYTRDGATPWTTEGMGAGTDYEATPVATTTVTTIAWYSWDITALVNGWRAGTYPNYGVVLMGISTNTYWKAFFSSDYPTAAYRPKLVVTYTQDTTPPITTASLSGIQGNNNWYISSVVLNLSATDPAPSAGGSITTYYKVNNGSYALYSGPVSFYADGDYYIEYYSIDGVGNQETPKSLYFRIDASPPSTTHTLAGTGGIDNWFSSDVICTLSGTDALSGLAGIYYSVDGGAESAYSSPFVISSPGTHTISYYGKDNAGNSESPHNVEVKIDKDLPETNHTLSGTLGTEGWYITDVTCTLTGSDPTSGLYRIFYKVDTMAEKIYTAPFTITGEGVHTLSYYGEDLAGNKEQPHTLQIKIDATAPVSSHALTGTAGENGWYISDVSVTITATDGGSQINKTYYRIDSSGWQVYTSPFKVSLEGNHTLEYYSTDIAGNIEKSKTLNLRIDKSPPVVSYQIKGTSSGVENWYISEVTLYLNATDGASGVAKIFYSINNGTYTQYTQPLKFSDGIYTVRYYAKDMAGNTEPESTLLLKIDTSNPTVTHLLPEPTGKNGWYVQDVVFELNASDELSGVEELCYSIDGGEAILYTAPVTITKEGCTNVSYWARDRVGHISEINFFEIWLDKTPPEITGNISGKSGKNGWLVSSATVKLGVNDACSGVEKVYYRINGGSYLEYSSQINLKEDGRYNITVYAVDGAGNEAQPVFFNVKIDTRPPRIEHKPVTEWLYLEEMKIGVQCTDENMVTIVALYYRTGNGEWRNMEMLSQGGEYTVTIPKEEVKLEGIEYYIVAEDEAGNQAVLPAGSPDAAPYHVNVHLNYWYLLLLIPIILLLLLIFALARRRAKEPLQPALPAAAVPDCPVCKFPIRPGADAYKCPQCGTITHANCMIRQKVCPKCALPMQVVVEKTKVVEKAREMKDIRGICVYPLEPGDEAYRCTCGAIYHGKCILELKMCPACKREIRVM
ncbi:MAG: DNRLRE domain-containing protein [Thermoplasmata archaeon]